LANMDISYCEIQERNHHTCSFFKSSVMKIGFSIKSFTGGYHASTEIYDNGAFQAHDRLRHVSDFNGDAQNDLVWYDSGSGGTKIWLLHNGLPIRQTTVLANPSWRVAQKAFFNADSDSDLLWHNSTTGEWVIWLM